MPILYKTEDAINMISGNLRVGVTHQRLKHLDDHGLLGTLTRTKGGHRVYTVQQIEAATVAIAFLELGYSVEEIKILMGTEDLENMSVVAQADYVIAYGRMTTALMNNIDLLRFVIHATSSRGEEIVNDLAKTNLHRKKKLMKASKTKKGLTREERKERVNLENLVLGIKVIKENIENLKKKAKTPLLDTE